MNGQVVKFEGSVHAETDRLLPWWVNGTLEGEEREQVAQHLAECAQCQREVEWLRSLQAQVQDETEVSTDAPRAMQRLRRRMRSAKAASAPAKPMPRRGWGRRDRWLAWVVAAQAAIVIGLGGIVAHNHHAAGEYRTLSSPDSRGALLVVTFDPQMTESQLRDLVRSNDTRIVGGPTEAGAYLLSVSPDRANRVRDSLRAAHGVTLAERMDVGGER